MGRHPYKGTAPKEPSSNPSAQEFADNMKKVQEEVGSALKKAVEDMTRYYNKKHSESIEYKKRDKVWLEGINVTTSCPMKKLDDKHFGPFKILEKVGRSSYKLNIPKTWRNIHNVFNEVLLTPYFSPEFPNQPKNTNLPPEDVGGEELEYEVEKIVDAKEDKRSKKVLYKVKWKGYGPHEMTWEPVSNLENAKGAIKEFHDKNPSKPRSREIRKLKIPMSIFPQHLFHPMPELLMTSIPTSMPTESMTVKLARSGICNLKRG